ncbi:uncharacterized protein MEPE_05268 [Melanopsichium pennsylvanicum]|uniref:Uncharacterized protein n=2 Tax=Melanopsichium pennsylvanicum TaxID=63383 RepID=A0AAJ4XP52_9BASI|nr:uncharacterized protein MEPE_05268 [Melanopsichium pennsylvanicum]
MSDSDPADSPSRSRLASRSDAGSVYNGDQSMSASLLSIVDPADMDEIENSVRQSKTIEDFTNIISEFRANRQTLYPDSLADTSAIDTSTFPASASHHSLDQHSEVGETIRCTCCCNKEECARALRARQEWRNLEADLRLSAEIGQALLRRHDAMQAKLQKQAEEYMQQRDGLMSRLAKSYKETSALERELAQSNLNLEAGDSSNRALLHELDDARIQLSKLRASQTRLSGADERAKFLQSEFDDLKQELAVERKRASAAEARTKKLELKSVQFKDALQNARKEGRVGIAFSGPALIDDAAIQSARDRLTQGLRHGRTFSLGTEVSFASDDAEQTQAIESLVRDNEALRTDNDKLRSLVDTANEELDTLRNSVNNAITIVASPLPDLARFDEDASDYLDSRRINQRCMELTASSAAHGHLGEPKDNLHKELQQNSEADKGDTPSTTTRPTMPADASLTGSFIFPGLSTTAPEGHAAPITRSGSLPFTTDSSTASKAPESFSFAKSSRSSETSRDTEKMSSDFLNFDPARRESRTAQLSNLLEYVNRLFTRLSTADVDTLTRRLHKQNLAGDAGHLARTTVHSILRDVDGLRDHFRKLIEAEARNHSRDDNSSHSKDFAGESLVQRKEFFSLLKSFRDILCELAKLRLCINDVHLNPGQAAKLLHDHLGANAAEDRSLIPIPSAVNWLGKMLLGGPSGTPAMPSPGAASPGATPAVPDAAASGAKGGRPITGRTISGHLAPRASPAVVSSMVAVEVKGTRASAAESSQSRLSVTPKTPVGGGLRAGPRAHRGRSQTSLTRVQSRNLSGLFAGSLTPSYPGSIAARGGTSDLGNSLAHTSSLRSKGDASRRAQPWQRPLSRIVDDDEISIHRSRAIRQQVFDDSDDDGSADEMNSSGNLLERTLRPRGLSDSSVRSTFIDLADGIGVGPASPAANRIRPAPIFRIITPAALSLHSIPSTAAVKQDSRSIDGIDSPSFSSERSGSLTPGAVGIAGGVASSIFSRSEKVLSFLSGGVVGAGALVQPSSASVSASEQSLRQTPSIAALNKAAARGAASQSLSVSPRNVPTTSLSSAQAGLGLGVPQRPALGGAGSGRAGF